MNGLLKTGLSTGVTGTVASVVTAAFLVLLAKAEGKSALQPTNQPLAPRRQGWCG